MEKPSSGRSTMVWNLVGYLAAALVLVAFYQTQTVPLRIAAIGSNLAFIAYGLALGLMPVWVLHFLLLALNTRRLVEACQVRQRSTQPSARRP
jgi:CRP/FNR family transcriptional regulator, cyclic AMP receptor protein